MRILAIRGRNLASLEGDFEVDFEAEPLNSAGIYAITGPTGAGKSTLLDAMCLALFNRVPRLANAKSGTIGDAGGEGISATDPRALLRHRAGEGFAEVDFMGVDRGRYRARWSVRRARERAVGALQNVRQQFTNLDTDNALGGTRTETLEAIQSKVGLTADQFCRAVMLAQGDFDAFVRADANERALLLERLTGSSIYARLGRAARMKADGCRAEFALLQSQIEAQNGLDDDARAAAEDTLATARASHATAVARSSQLKADRDWYRTKDLLEQRVSEAAAALERARVAQQETGPRRAALDLRRRAASFVPAWQSLEETREKARQAQANAELAQAQVAASEAMLLTAQNDEREASLALSEASRTLEEKRPEIDKARSLDRDIANTTAELAPLLAAKEAATAKESKAEADHQTAILAKEAAEATLAEHNRWLTEHQDRERLALRSDDILADLAEHAAEEQALGEIRNELAMASTESTSADQKLAAAREIAQVAEDEQRVAKHALEAARSQAPAASVVAEATGKRDALAALKPILLSLSQAETNFRTQQAAVDRYAAEVEQASQSLAQSTERSAVVRAEMPKVEARYEEALRARRLSDAAADDAAGMLRETLIEGEPCPVCGSTEHALDQVTDILAERARDDHDRCGELATQLSGLRDEAATLAERSRTCEAQRARAVADKSAAEAARGIADQARTAAKSELELATETLDFPIDRPTAEMSADLESRLTEIAEARRGIDEALSALEAARTAEEVARSSHTDADRKLRKAEEASRQAASKLSGIRGREARAKAALEKLATTITTHVERHFDWRLERDAANQLQTLVDEWKHRGRARDAATAEISAKAAAAHAAQLEHERNKVAAVAAKRASEDHVARLARLQRERAPLLNSEDTDTFETRMRDAVTAANDRRDAAARASSEHKAAVAATTARRDECSSARSSCEREAEKKDEQLTSQLRKAGLEVSTIAQEAAAEEGSLQQEAEALQTIDRAVVAAGAEHQARVGDRDTHIAQGAPAATQEELTTAVAEAEVAEAAAHESVTESELIIRQDDATRQRTASLRAELARKKAQAEVTLQLDDLIGDATGNAFRKFAQGLTLDRLVLHANERLAELKPRYTLERAVGGDMLLQVVDHDMAGEVRGLHNLSGGERFLVSLALALGLAEMSTGRGLSIESLFIDEGFGALDSASLADAVAMLEQLHATGRRVGIISHIEEVKERIPVKVSVTPIARGQSTLQVVVE